MEKEAWVVIFDNSENESLNGELAQMGERYMVYREKKMAEKEARRDNLKIVPCTITYELPTKK